MADFIVATDSACDLPLSVLEERNIPYVELSYLFVGEDVDYTNSQLPVDTFYQRMREGGVAKTAAINVGQFAEFFQSLIPQGKDIYFVAFSGGLSSTADNAATAAAMVMEANPGVRIAVLDTLCASAGQGMAVLLADDLRKEGKSFEETVARMAELAPRICHWFTVEDLVYLERGGRVSKVAATAGNLLNIKPVLHVADDGKLYNVSKARGRKRSIEALFAHMMESADAETKGYYLISHGDCLDDAKALEEMIRKETGTDAACITYVGPVIGAHSGPGTLALFFLGTPR